MRKGMDYGMFALGAIVAMTSVKIIYDTCFFKRNEIMLRTDKWPNKTACRIVQISDLHNRRFGNGNEKLVSAIRERNPDVVVITGDLIDRKTRRFSLINRFIESLTAVEKHIYFISGNHEWEHIATELFIDGLKSRDVRILDQTTTVLTLDNHKLKLIGVGYQAEMNEAIDRGERTSTNETYTVLLTHMPDGIDMSKTDADLILSGHTHGGQIRFPFVGAVIAPGQGLFPKWAKGVYPLENNRFMYIDSGLGTTHLPIRFLNQSQFSVIDIKGKF